MLFKYSCKRKSLASSGSLICSNNIRKLCITSGESIPFWLRKNNVPKFKTLMKDEQTDVCVVGGGISGLTSAYFLSLKGKSVVLLEDGEIGSGETGRTTAHIASAVDDRFFELENRFGVNGARTMASAHMSAVDQIENIINKESIECEFSRIDGYLFLSEGHSIDLLEKELKASQRAGFKSAELVDQVPLTSFKSGPAIRFPNQAQFHPIKYLSQLAKAAERNGVKIFTNTHATSMKGSDILKERAKVTTNNGTIVTADHLIVATNVPVNDRMVMYSKLEPRRTYVITFKVKKGSVPEALYWDSGDPYHYVRLAKIDSNNDLLIVGGEDHKVGHNFDHKERFERLNSWTKERFPIMEPPVDRWSGQIIETIDSVAFIGRNPGDYPNVYIITGDSGNGITHGTIGGMMITDMIEGKEHKWESFFDPSRKMLSEKKEFLVHNLDVGAQYVDWITKGENQDTLQLKPNQGAVIRKGLTKIAVYKDEKGVCHQMSAICPHMKAIVHWNDFEKTWSCPAHGSNFDPFGHVVNGPANSNLAEVNLKKEEDETLTEKTPFLR